MTANTQAQANKQEENKTSKTRNIFFFSKNYTLKSLWILRKKPQSGFCSDIWRIYFLDAYIRFFTHEVISTHV